MQEHNFIPEKKRLNEEAKELYVAPKLKWGYEVLRNRKDRDTHTSEIHRWYFQEKEKRQKKQDNEIDRADMKAALMGVKNTWTATVKQHEAKFMEDIEWAEAMELKKQCAEKTASEHTAMG